MKKPFTPRFFITGCYCGNRVESYQIKLKKWGVFIVVVEQKWHSNRTHAIDS